MMIPSGENGDFDPMVHVEQQGPEQWIRIHGHHPHHRHDGIPRFPMGKHHDFFANKRFPEEREERFPMGKHHDFFAEKSFPEERDRERFQMGKHHDFFADKRFVEERQAGGFLRSVRKFLNGQF